MEQKDLMTVSLTVGYENNWTTYFPYNTELKRVKEETIEYEQYGGFYRDNRVYYDVMENVNNVLSFINHGENVILPIRFWRSGDYGLDEDRNTFPIFRNGKFEAPIIDDVSDLSYLPIKPISYIRFYLQRHTRGSKSIQEPNPDYDPNDPNSQPNRYVYVSDSDLFLNPTSPDDLEDVWYFSLVAPSIQLGMYIKRPGFTANEVMNETVQKFISDGFLIMSGFYNGYYINYDIYIPIYNPKTPYIYKVERALPQTEYDL